MSRWAGASSSRSSTPGPTGGRAASRTTRPAAAARKPATSSSPATARCGGGSEEDRRPQASFCGVSVARGGEAAVRALRTPPFLHCVGQPVTLRACNSGAPLNGNKPFAQQLVECLKSNDYDKSFPHAQVTAPDRDIYIPGGRTRIL